MGKPPRKLRFTRMGRWYLAFTLILGIAAINTGNNLLFLILGLLLAGIVLSGVLSESTLRGVSVERFLPSEPVAGKPALVGLRIHNSKGRIASYAITAHDFAKGEVEPGLAGAAGIPGAQADSGSEMGAYGASASQRTSGGKAGITSEGRSEAASEEGPGATSGTSFHTTLNASSQASSDSTSDFTADSANGAVPKKGSASPTRGKKRGRSKAHDTSAKASESKASDAESARPRRKGELGFVFALKVDGGTHRDLAYTWIPSRRGRVELDRVELSTRFPFGLFEKSREFELPAQVVVLPREVPAPPIPLRRSPIVGERPTNQVGHGSEFFALRDLRPGDDSRSIHWRSSAKRGKPVVVERERERRRQIAIRVDNRLPLDSQLGFSQENGTEKGGRGLSLGKALNLAASNSRRKKENRASFDSREEALDRAVEKAAALARRAHKEGCDIALSTSDVWIPMGSGPGAERKVLRALALLQPVEEGPSPRHIPGADMLDVPVRQSAAVGVQNPAQGSNFAETASKRAATASASPIQAGGSADGQRFSASGNSSTGVEMNSPMSDMATAPSRPSSAPRSRKEEE